MTTMSGKQLKRMRQGAWCTAFSTVHKRRFDFTVEMQLLHLFKREYPALYETGKVTPSYSQAVSHIYDLREFMESKKQLQEEYKKRDSEQHSQQVNSCVKNMFDLDGDFHVEKQGFGQSYIGQQNDEIFLTQKKRIY